MYIFISMNFFFLKFKLRLGRSKKVAVDNTSFLYI